MADFIGGRGQLQRGSIPRRSTAPTASELPTDSGTGKPLALIWLDVSVGVVKVSAPDGSGGVATGTVVDLTGSVSL